jgi:hypothetical protein
VRVIGRYLAWVVLLCAGAVLVRDALVWHDTQLFAPESLADLWTDLSAESLRQLHLIAAANLPWFWKSVLEPALHFWAAPALILIALWILWVSRPPQRRR